MQYSSNLEYSTVDACVIELRPSIVHGLFFYLLSPSMSLARPATTSARRAYTFPYSPANSSSSSARFALYFS